SKGSVSRCRESRAARPNSPIRRPAAGSTRGARASCPTARRSSPASTSARGCRCAVTCMPMATERAEVPAAVTAEPIIEATGLTRHFRIGGPLSRHFLHAVEAVDLAIRPNEIVALVGESGSGKSTVARLLARVYKPTRGDITYHGRSLSAMKSRRERLGYAARVPMVFQDPYGSLSPVYRVSHGVTRALKLHRPDLTASQREQEAER